MLHHTSLTFKEELTHRTGLTRVILHHTADSRPHTVEDVHKAQINTGFAGIAYHYFIRKDGEIYEGRPVWAIGAHTKGYNEDSIGVCFEGDFNKEKMSETQLEASVMLLSLLGLAREKEDYDVEICRHDDLVEGKVPSPGKLFPFDELMCRVNYCQDLLKSLFGEERDHEPWHMDWEARNHYNGMGDDEAVRRRMNAPEYVWSGNFYYEKIIDLFADIEEEDEF